MEIYRYESAVGNYQSFLLGSEREQIYELFSAENHLAALWRPPRVEVVNSCFPTGDFPGLSLHIPVVSGRAWKALEPYIGMSVEALPLATDEQYFALNVTKVIPCLDVANSRIVRNRLGNVTWIHDYSFHKNVLSDTYIFKLPETAYSEILVTNLFSDLVSRRDLKGLHLRKLEASSKNVQTL